MEYGNEFEAKACGISLKCVVVRANVLGGMGQTAGCTKKIELIWEGVHDVRRDPIYGMPSSHRPPNNLLLPAAPAAAAGSERRRRALTGWF